MYTFKLTLTPNQSDPPRYVNLVVYERRGDRLARLLKRGNRNRWLGVKTIPFDRNKDWSREQGERYTNVPVNGKPANMAADEYLAGADVERFRYTKETPRTKVWGIAKRDWLIAAGYVRPTQGLTEKKVELEWVPGQYPMSVIVNNETGEEEWENVSSIHDVDNETHDSAVVGGYYKVKE